MAKYNGAELINAALNESFDPHVEAQFVALDYSQAYGSLQEFTTWNLEDAGVYYNSHQPTTEISVQLAQDLLTILRIQSPSMREDQGRVEVNKDIDISYLVFKDTCVLQAAIYRTSLNRPGMKDAELKIQMPLDVDHVSYGSLLSLRYDPNNPTSAPIRQLAYNNDSQSQQVYLEAVQEFARITLGLPSLYLPQSQAD
jgi:hypothetical protein